ncbi:DoxX family protein [Streptomyces sp. NPDC049881]|uniref:DoxX family protein n=1 Tax=Streptomyces sp. NPDC049881 TaxID=3155778 RepID=UPI00344452A1
MQAVLAAVFALSGLLKLVLPIDRLAAQLPVVRDYAPRTMRLIGLAELLGAIGLIVPAATGIAPALTPAAATGLAVLMLLAARAHLRRSESQALPGNAVLFLLAALVAWARFGPYAW